MTDRNDDQGIDEDRTEGSLKKMGGNIKEGAGKVLGDEKLKRDGQSDQTKGKVQNAFGGAKDKAHEVLGGKD
jgi:uncharacterized protein YjbJ (UPF0337 family)